MLYIATKSPESLPIDDGYDVALYRDILHNIVFRYAPDGCELINYFMGMKRIPPRPDVIIVDFLHTFFGNLSCLDTDNGFQQHFISCHMLMTASLLGAVDVLSNDSPNQFISIVCVDPEHHNIYKRFIQIFVDLYYYKDGCILTSADLSTHFP